MVCAQQESFSFFKYFLPTELKIFQQIANMISLLDYFVVKKKALIKLKRCKFLFIFLEENLIK